MTVLRVIPNKYAGRCSKCGKRVAEETGIAFTTHMGWAVAHHACRPDLSEMLSVKVGVSEATEKAAQEKEAQVAARREALRTQLQIDVEVEHEPKTVQGAWSDDHTWYYAFNGDGTMEEFREFLETRAQSSSGALRWSGGRRVVQVDSDQGRVYMRESSRLAD